MRSDKSVVVSFRVSRRFKELLERAAAADHRSQTNMVERLLFDHCAKHGLDSGRPASAAKRAKKVAE
jgi:hypothetical protein